MKRLLAVLVWLAGSMTAFAQVNIYGLRVDAKSGFTYQGGAPTGQVLCGIGGVFLPSATCGAAAAYQFIQLNGGAAFTQRSTLNFGGAFSVTDTSPSTSVDLAPVGTAASIGPVTSMTTDSYGRVTAAASTPIGSAGSISTPVSVLSYDAYGRITGAGAPSVVTAATVTPVASITYDAYGRITAASPGSAVNRTCNANGCYRIESDGTINAWGTIGVGFSGGAAGGSNTISYPIGFASNPVLLISGGGQADGVDDGYTMFHRNDSTVNSVVVVRCTVNIGGSGCPGTPGGTISVNWHAIGNL